MGLPPFPPACRAPSRTATAPDYAPSNLGAVNEPAVLPEADETLRSPRPRFPTPERSAGPVGFDAETNFALPSTPVRYARLALPRSWSNFQIAVGIRFVHRGAFRRGASRPDRPKEYRYCLRGAVARCASAFSTRERQTTTGGCDRGAPGPLMEEAVRETVDFVIPLVEAASVRCAA